MVFEIIYFRMRHMIFVCVWGGGGEAGSFYFNLKKESLIGNRYTRPKFHRSLKIHSGVNKTKLLKERFFPCPNDQQCFSGFCLYIVWNNIHFRPEKVLI